MRVRPFVSMEPKIQRTELLNDLHETKLAPHKNNTQTLWNSDHKNNHNNNQTPKINSTQSICSTRTSSPSISSHSIRKKSGHFCVMDMCSYVCILMCMCVYSARTCKRTRFCATVVFSIVFNLSTVLSLSFSYRLVVDTSLMFIGYIVYKWKRRRYVSMCK